MQSLRRQDLCLTPWDTRRLGYLPQVFCAYLACLSIYGYATIWITASSI